MAPVELRAPFELETVPDCAAVFLVHAREGRPYLGRTSLLRRRLKRLRFGGVMERVEYYPAVSRLGQSLLFYELAKLHYPEDYTRIVKLRMPPYVKALLSNEFPRTLVTTRLSGPGAFHYGPFRTRAAAERFESEVLDLFQVRRCQEDLAPSPEHPGCIYGEMMRCLRPCQEVVSVEEYRSEAERLVHFLETGGSSALESIRAARERFSEEMNFEEAQRQHQRYQRVEAILKLRDELACDVRKLNGVAVGASAAPGFVGLRFLTQGLWGDEIEFRITPESTGEMVPMDRRLRETVEGLTAPRGGAGLRMEHVALLTKWYYSSWRDGEWIGYERIEELPYRKLVRAISRVAGGKGLRED
jgi:excinuclease UvrABC nuclease subunit